MGRPGSAPPGQERFSLPVGFPRGFAAGFCAQPLHVTDAGDGGRGSTCPLCPREGRPLAGAAAQCSSVVVQRCNTVRLIADANDPRAGSRNRRQAAGIGGSASRESSASDATASPGAVVKCTGGSLEQGDGFRRGTRGAASPGLASSSELKVGRKPPLQCCTCLQAVALFPEAGLPRFHCRSDSQGASLPPRQVSAGRSQLPDSEHTWGKARDSLSRAGLVLAARLRGECSSSRSDRGKMCRQRKETCQPRTSHTLASVLPRAELISAYDTEASAQGLTCPRFAREHTPRFCLSALMRADNGTGLGSRDFNQRCPKPSESH